MTIKCVKINVTGVVQGVGFRFYTQKQAVELQLTGYVQNKDDGRVEIVAQGTPEHIEGLLNWIKKGGPANARIKQVSVDEISYDKLDKFSIIH